MLGKGTEMTSRCEMDLQVTVLRTKTQQTAVPKEQRCWPSHLSLLPSAPNTSPQWEQKKCSGCHVLFIAVSTFWNQDTQRGIRSLQSCKACPGLFMHGQTLHESWQGWGFTYICDGSGTVGTAWREQVVVVFWAVGQAVPFKEGTGAQLLLAVSADKVLWVPGLPQSMDHLEHHKAWHGRAAECTSRGHSAFHIDNTSWVIQLQGSDLGCSNTIYDHA